MNQIITIGIATALSLGVALPVFAAGTTTLTGAVAVSPEIHTTHVSPTTASTTGRVTTNKTHPRLMRGTLKLNADSSLVLTVSGVEYTISVSNSTVVLNRLRKSAKLTDFSTGDSVRVYGAVKGTSITAQIIRDTTIPVIVKSSITTKHPTRSTSTHN